MRIIYERQPALVKLIGGPGDGEYMTLSHLPDGTVPQTITYACRIDSRLRRMSTLRGDEIPEMIGQTYYHRFELRFNDDSYFVFYHTDMKEADILPTLINGYAGKGKRVH